MVPQLKQAMARESSSTSVATLFSGCGDVAGVDSMGGVDADFSRLLTTTRLL